MLPGFIIAVPKTFPNTKAKANTVGSVTVSLPANIQAGDILVLAVGVGGDQTLATPSGWTSLGAGTSGATSANRKIQVFWKVASGSEGASLTVAITVQALAWLFGNARSVEATFTGSSAGSGNSPSITASWGQDAAKFLSVEMVRASTGIATAWPSGYTDTQAVAGSATSASSAEANKYVATEDPSAFVNSVNDDWGAATIAIRPASY